MVDLVITGGKIVTPEGIYSGDIAIQNGRIAAITTKENLPKAKKSINAAGRYILPGIVDPEGHIGSRGEADFVTETCAALASGVTTWGLILDTPRLASAIGYSGGKEIPPYSEVFPRFQEVGDQFSRVDYFFTAVIQTDEQALGIPKLADQFGITSFKFYLHRKAASGSRSTKSHSINFKGALDFDDGTVYLGMENTSRIGPPGIVVIHPENYEIARIFDDRLWEAGRKDMATWNERSPHFCEAGHVRTYAYYAKVTGCPLYIIHVTTQETIDEIVRARAEGVQIYGQTSACYLSLDEDVWKLDVPLRESETIPRLWQGLRDGIVDCTGSDHVNYRKSRQEMEVKGDMWNTQSGFPSRVEALLPVLLSEGVNKGRLSLERLVEVACKNPAKIYGIYPKKGAVQVGADADLVIVDLDLSRTVTNQMVHSATGWTIYEGWQFKGWPVMTILRGDVVMEWPEAETKARIVGDPKGQYVPRKPGHKLYPHD